MRAISLAEKEVKMRMIIWVLGIIFITNYFEHLGMDLGDPNFIFFIGSCYAVVLDIIKK
jgi:hypothetical protein